MFLQQDGNGLGTICTTQTRTTWVCNSFYAPPNGLISSLNQQVADTKATWQSDGSVRMSALNEVAGQRLNGAPSMGRRQWAMGGPAPGFPLRRMRASGTAASEISIR